YPHLIYLIFYLLVLWLALIAQKTESAGVRAALGIALALAAFTLDHLPVLVLLVVLLLWRRSLLPFGGLIFLASSWTAWEIHLYGQSHFLASVSARAGNGYAWNAAYLPLIFLAGGFPFLIVGWPYLYRRSKLAAGLLGVLALLSWTIFSGPR